MIIFIYRKIKIILNLYNEEVLKILWNNLYVNNIKMDFIEMLWHKSFKKWNFFYDLQQLKTFNKLAYDKLIKNIILYKKDIKNKKDINKNIISQIYIFMWIFIWIIRDFEEWKYDIIWIEKKEDLFDYYEELDWEIILLLTNR